MSGKIGIIVGHEENAPGVVATFPINLSEYHFNKTLSLEIYRAVQDAGYECRVFLRDRTTRDGVTKAVNSWISDDDGVSVELHLNAFDGKTRGTETLYSVHSDDSKMLALLVQSYVCEALGRTGKSNRGLKILEFGDRGSSNLRKMDHPACLVEPVFADNKDDAALLSSQRLLYAESIAESCIEFLKKYKETVK